MLVKLLFTLAMTLALMLAGSAISPEGGRPARVVRAGACCSARSAILSIGFLVASVVPTARFAQPVGTLLFYPMLGLSGLFVPIAVLPPRAGAGPRAAGHLRRVADEGIWHGEGWVAHTGDLAALAAVFVICVTLSAWVFRWE